MIYNDNMKLDLSLLPVRLRDAFTTKVTKSAIPGYAPGAKLDSLLWLIPKNSQSPQLVYECDATLNYYEDPRAWLVDSNSGEWIHLIWPINIGLDELNKTLTRVLREDIVLYELESQFHREGRFSKIGLAHAETKVILPVFEMDRPNPEQAPKEIRRLNRWSICDATVSTGKPSKMVQSRESRRSAIIDLFMNELESVTGALFTWKFVDGDMTDGKIELLPENPRAKLLHLLVCNGLPSDLLTGNNYDFYNDVADNILEFSTPLISELPLHVRGIFDYCVSWIMHGLVETREPDAAISQLSLVRYVYEFHRTQPKIKRYRGGPWRRVTFRWEPW